MEDGTRSAKFNFDRIYSVDSVDNYFMYCLHIWYIVTVIYTCILLGRTLNKYSLFWMRLLCGKKKNDDHVRRKAIRSHEELRPQRDSTPRLTLPLYLFSYHCWKKMKKKKISLMKENNNILNQMIKSWNLQPNIKNLEAKIQLDRVRMNR